jgi:hypothetical protein
MTSMDLAMDSYSEFSFHQLDFYRELIPKRNYPPHQEPIIQQKICQM